MNTTVLKPLSTPALLLALLVCHDVAHGAVDLAAVDKAVADLPRIDYGDASPAAAAIDSAILAAGAAAAVKLEIERRLCRVLADDSTRAARDFVCRKLQQIGTAHCVPALAPLLPDKDHSHMARYALEAIGGPEASKALRDALGKASGLPRIGIINSIGQCGDAQATDALIALLKAPDSQTAAAAARALGKIGGATAAAAVNQARKQAPTEVALDFVDGCLLAASQLAAADKPAAKAIFVDLLDASLPQRVRFVALQGLIAVDPAEGGAALAAAIRTDAVLRPLAVGLVATAPGERTTTALIACLPDIKEPAVRAAMIAALGDRKDKAARPVALDAAKDADAALRAAGYRALANLGDAADVPLLVAGAAGSGPDAQAAQATLVALPDPAVNGAMTRLLDSATPAEKSQVIAGLSARGAREAAPVILKAAASGDAPVRAAALGALSVLGDSGMVGELVKLLKAAATDDDRSAVEKAIKAVAGRVGVECAPAIVAGLKDAPPPAALVLVRCMVVAPSEQALGAVRSTIAGAQGELRDEAVRVLSNWPDAAAMPDLLNLARSADVGQHVLGLRGYIRLTAASKEPAGAKLKMCQTAMELAKRPDEKRLVLGALGGIPSADALDLVMSLLKPGGLAEEASAAAVRIGEKLTATDPAAVKAAMAKVLQVTRNRGTRAAAERLSK